jgi:murein DD-endopeptidase MepM/ murein hydrolase activator NlpD
VDSVYKDSMLGNCVKIKSANDVVTVYAGLLKSDSVKKGDAVEAGELIGQIGNTAASESTEDPHLHFEVWVKGVPANPEPYFKN